MQTYIYLYVHNRDGSGVETSGKLYEDILYAITQAAERMSPGAGERIWTAITQTHSTRWTDGIAAGVEASREFPGQMFELHFNGLDGGPDDDWSYYFKNGKYQVIGPVITWPKPTEDKWTELVDDTVR